MHGVLVAIVSRVAGEYRQRVSDGLRSRRPAGLTVIQTRDPVAHLPRPEPIVLTMIGDRDRDVGIARGRMPRLSAGREHQIDEPRSLRWAPAIGRARRWRMRSHRRVEHLGRDVWMLRPDRGSDGLARQPIGIGADHLAEPDERGLDRLCGRRLREAGRIDDASQRRPIRRRGDGRGADGGADRREVRLGSGAGHCSAARRSAKANTSARANRTARLMPGMLTFRSSPSRAQMRTCVSETPNVWPMSRMR
jgi:hypothetical protein